MSLRLINNEERSRRYCKNSCRKKQNVSLSI